MGRKWKTPKCLKTPHLNELSFMSIENEEEEEVLIREVEHEEDEIKVSRQEESNDEDDEGKVKVKLVYSPVPKEIDERKRKNLASTIGDRRKRLRVAIPSTVVTTKKKSQAASISNNEDIAKKLDFSLPANSTATDGLVYQYKVDQLIKLEKESKGENLTLSHLTSLESSLVLIQKTLNNTDKELQEKSIKLLSQIHFRMNQILNLAESIKMKGNECYTCQKYEDAERFYREVCRMDSNSSINYTNHAASLIMLGRLTEAIKSCDEAIKIDPNCARAYLRSARALLMLGQYSNASARVNYVVLHFNDSSSSSSLTQRDEACEMAEQITKFRVAMEIGDSYFGSFFPEKSLKQANECLEIAPSSLHAKALQLVSNVMIHCMKRQENNGNSYVNSLMKELDGIVAKLGSNRIFQYALVFYCRGFLNQAIMILRLVQNWDQTNDQVKKHLELFTEIDSSISKIRKHQEENCFNESIRCCNEVLRLIVQNDILSARVILSRSKSYFLSGRIQDCENDCYCALRKFPEYFEARLLLSRAFVATDKLIEAENELSNVLLYHKNNLIEINFQEIQSIREEIQQRLSKRNNERATKKQEEEEQNKKSYQSKPFPSSSRYDPFKENDGRMKRETHYSLLGVSKTATNQEIRKAYKGLALKFHPDKNSDPKAVEVFKKIVEAVGVISSPSKRRVYDLSI